MRPNYKNKAIWLIAIVAVCAASMISGCKKLVEIDVPRDKVVPEDVFATDAQAYTALAGVYSQLMSNTGALTFSNGATSLYAGLTADELVSYAGVGNTTTYQFETNTLLSDNLNIDSYFWKPAYKVINGANNIIEGVAASKSTLLTDSARVQLVGESKFVRAFNYFYLTNLFGNVPLVLSTDFNKTVTLSNASEADLYAQIKQDLLDAQSTLKTNYSISGGERVRANKWAATALLARVYLYQKEWKNAETQATSIINNGQFSMVSNLANVFLKNSTETILQFQQAPTVPPYSGNWDARNFFPTFAWSSGFSIYLASAASYAAVAAAVIPPYPMSKQLISAFETGDNRKTVWTSMVPTPNDAPYGGVPYYFPYKYNNNSSSATAAITQYYMVFRLAEQYLIRAEARAQQTDLNGAANDLNVVRNRAGLPNTTATSQGDLLIAIAHERQTELFCEWGNRLFDLKRTGKASATLGSITSKQPFNDYQLLYPIPPNELKNDAFLQQNPGYF